MAKKTRFKGIELYHHIYNRGNDRHPLFKVSSDYKRYLSYLSRYSKHYDIDIIAYSLMEWHIHLFIFDRSARISEFINALHGRYGQIYNKIYDRVGHVFGSRFKSKVVDVNTYGIWLSRYIHLQAVEAGLVGSPEDYLWSSYSVYTGKQKNSLLKPDIILLQFGNRAIDCAATYKKFVENKSNEPINWKKVELTSQPIIGDKKFSKALYSKLGYKVKQESTVEQLVQLLNLRLEISIDVLKHPIGKAQKKLRYQAILLLRDEFGYGVREIARILKIAPASVCRILKTDN